MTALIAWVLANPTVLAIIAGIVGALGFGLHQRRAGAKAERNRQAKADLKAVRERLEMDREATEAEREAARLSDETARKRALEWARKQSFLQD